ncbi:MAG: hypothetical protein JWM76_5086 [Pseudonocardiales bacterium]|nr:hypothetical protein [Pseudonocardiales bacterium]
MKRRPWSVRTRAEVLRWSVIGAGAIVLVATGWIVITAVLARAELNHARSELSSMRADVLDGRIDAATADARKVQSHAARADQLTSGPAWAVASHVPFLGSPLRTVRGATSQVHVVAREVISPLVSIAPDVDPKKIVNGGGHVDTAPLVRAAPVLSKAAASGERVRAAVKRWPAHTWLSPVDHARASLLDQMTQLQSTLSAGAKAADVAPTLLGMNSPQRYVVGLLNPAESRGVGGIPGAFVIVVADKGTLTSTHFESDRVFADADSGIDLGADYDARYGSAAPTSTYANSTISPNFPDAAKIWAAMWQKVSGEKVDGAISVDPTALSYLLKVTGAAALPSGEKVTSANVVPLTEQVTYARFATVNERKDFLLAVARAVDDKVLALDSDPAKLVKAAGHAVDERRLLLWSADPKVQASLGDSSIAGLLAPTKAPFAEMSVTNVTGGKLDYYLNRSMKWQSSGCGANRTVTVTMTITNDVPAGTLPTYVTLRVDNPAYPTTPGDNRLALNYFATAGATLQSVSVDGAKSTARSGTEQGHPVFYFDLEVKKNATRTVVLTLKEPGSGSPTVVTQPLARPLDLTVVEPKC